MGSARRRLALLLRRAGGVRPLEKGRLGTPELCRKPVSEQFRWVSTSRLNAEAAVGGVWAEAGHCLVRKGNFHQLAARSAAGCAQSDSDLPRGTRFWSRVSLAAQGQKFVTCEYVHRAVLSPTLRSPLSRLGQAAVLQPVSLGITRPRAVPLLLLGAVALLCAWARACWDVPLLWLQRCRAELLSRLPLRTEAVYAS